MRLKAFSVTLQEPSSAGCLWNYIPDPEKFVVVYKQPLDNYYVGEDGYYVDDAIGSPRLVEFMIIPQTAEKFDVVFELRRPWEDPHIDPADKYIVSVNNESREA